MAFPSGLINDSPHLRPLERRLQGFWQQIMLLVG